MPETEAVLLLPMKSRGRYLRKTNCTTVDPRPVSGQSMAHYDFVCSSLIPDICGLPGNKDHVLFTWFDV